MAGTFLEEILGVTGNSFGQFSSMVETIFRFIGFITIGWVFLFLSKAVQRVTKIIHKLSTSFSNLRGVVQPVGTIPEVVPNYKGSYADYTMKKAHPTADMLSPKFNYQLTSPCKGIAFILNNFEFDGNERYGSQIDLDNMVHLFQEIGYKNMIHENLTANGIRDSVRSFASMFNGDTYDSAVIVLMSHGNRGVILGTDLAQVNLRDLEREFEGDNCPGLNGKPKMFFVQACRGDLPLRIPVVADRPYPKAHTGVYGDLETLHDVPDNRFARNNDDVADVHIAFATTEGKLSLRSEVIGSFFVQALCEVFFANAHQDNLDTLMNKVAYRVDRMKGKLYNHTSGKWISVKQTPECLKRGMRKSLYFLPNYSKSK